MARQSSITLANARRDQTATFAVSFEQKRRDTDTRSLSITPAPMRCQVCGGNLIRSRVRWWERDYATWTAKRPYRCPRCQTRGWFGLPPQSATAATRPLDPPEKWTIVLETAVSWLNSCKTRLRHLAAQRKDHQ